MKRKLTKSDIIWSYVSKIMSLASGIITLPLILHYLSKDEIALNYIFMSIMSIAALFDLGFSAQFSRNFAVVFGGGQKIEAKGITNKVSNKINYQTLYILINSAKCIYFILSVIMALALLTGGTIYVYKFTEGFSLIHNCLFIWLAFAITVVIDFYFTFYTSLLMGENLIKEVSQIEISAICLKIFILTVIILTSGNLWAVVISNGVKIILSRYLSRRYFYTDFIKQKFYGLKANFDDTKDTVIKLWYNAKRLTIVRLSTYFSTQLGLFLSGLFLTKQDVSSFGLLCQLVSIVGSISSLLNTTQIPLYSTLRVNHNTKQLYYYFTLSLGGFFFIDISGALFITFCVPPLLNLIGSNTTLPGYNIILLYILYKFLEDQHCICSSFLTTKNIIVDRHSAPIIGFIVASGLYFILKYTSWGLVGIVFIQFIIPLCYPNWKWPWEVCKEFKVSYPTLVQDSLKTILSIGKQFVLKNKIISNKNRNQLL